MNELVNVKGLNKKCYLYAMEDNFEKSSILWKVASEKHVYAKAFYDIRLCSDFGKGVDQNVIMVSFFIGSV